MTIREHYTQYLEGNGLLPGQAASVMDAVEANDDPMKGRWQDQVSDYPPLMIRALVLSVNAEALAWIESNCPNAWFKPMFAEQSKPQSGKE